METRNTVLLSINLPWAFLEKIYFYAPDMYTIPESDSCTYSVHKRTNHKNNISTYILLILTQFIWNSRILALQPWICKSFSRSPELFFLAVAQNNFWNKIPTKIWKLKHHYCLNCPPRRFIDFKEIFLHHANFLINPEQFFISLHEFGAHYALTKHLSNRFELLIHFHI